MKYAFEPRPAELQGRLDRIRTQFATAYARECKAYEIVEILKDTKLWNSSPENFSYETDEILNYFGIMILKIYTQGYPIDMVIDSFCSIIHQQFGVDWTLSNYHGTLLLKTIIRNFQMIDVEIRIMVYEGSNKTCELISEKVVVSSYRYSMKCENGDEG